MLRLIYTRRETLVLKVLSAVSSGSALIHRTVADVLCYLKAFQHSRALLKWLVWEAWSGLTGWQVSATRRRGACGNIK